MPMKKVGENEDGKGEKEKKEKVDYRRNVEEYFSQYSGFFKNESAKAVFLEGALVGFLLEVQRMQNQEKETTEAFWRSLHSLKLDSRQVLLIFPKAVEKLKVLGMSYSSFVEVVSEYIQKAGTPLQLDNLEISWYFTHGLASYRRFRGKKKKDSK
ncbi:MAG: TM1802 family CRISPR-associated protein [Promethearchaeota archaeon]